MSQKLAPESGGRSAPALEQILVRNPAHGSRRHSHDDAALSDVGDDHGAGSDKCLGADLDRRTDDNASADPASACQTDGTVRFVTA